MSPVNIVSSFLGFLAELLFLKKPVKHSHWVENIKTVVYAVLLAVVFRSFAYEPFHIPSGSMKNGLLVGDYLFVSKYSYGYSRYSFPFAPDLFEGRVGAMRAPERGEVAVFRNPKQIKLDYIKRVIGLPGDRVQVKKGLLYINGVEMPRRHVGEFVDDEDPRHVQTLMVYEQTLPEGQKINILEASDHGIADDTMEYVVPEGHYFLMGDNRDNSRDSRFLDEVGFVPLENFVGPAQIIFFSISQGFSLRFDRFFKMIH